MAKNVLYDFRTVKSSTFVTQLYTDNSLNSIGLRAVEGSYMLTNLQYGKRLIIHVLNSMDG